VIGKVQIETVGEAPAGITYMIEVNGVQKKISDEETLNVKRGDKIMIVDVFVPGVNGSDIKVNLKGFAPRNVYNDGEDRNSLVDTRGLNWNKYSVNGEGKKYPIVVTRGTQEITKAYIYIQD